MRGGRDSSRVTPARSPPADAGSGAIGQGDAPRDRGSGESERLGFLVGQGRLRAPARDGLSVDPRAATRVKAADDDPVVVGVEQRQGEALIAPGVLERVEPDQADPLERLATARLEGARPSRKSVDGRRDLDDTTEVCLEHRLQASAVLAPGQRIEAPADVRGPPDGQDGDAECPG